MALAFGDQNHGILAQQALLPLELEAITVLDAKINFDFAAVTDFVAGGGDVTDPNYPD